MSELDLKPRTIALIRRDARIAELERARDALRAACFTVKDYLNRLEGLPEDDPLLAMRRHFHAPLHKAIDTALEQSAAQSSERAE
jgi:hypothetical protein